MHRPVMKSRMRAFDEVWARFRPSRQAIAKLRASVLPLAAVAVLPLLVVNAASFESVCHMDFGQIYSSAFIVREGRAGKLYDTSEQARVEKRLLNRELPRLLNHPPFEAFFFTPLTHFSLIGAYKIWAVFNISLWILFFHLLYYHAPVPKRLGSCMVACFAFFPAWTALMEGQTSLLILFIYALVFMALRRRREFAAGILLGVGLIKFQLVLPFVLISLLRRKWRLAAGFAVVALTLGGISVAVVGLPGVLSYGKLLIDVVKDPGSPAYEGVLPRDMPSLRGFLDTILSGTDALIWTMSIVVLVSLSIIWLTASRWRRNDKDERSGSESLMFAMALAVTLITSFHLYYYDLSLMLLPILLVLGSVRWKEGTRWHVLLALSVVLLYIPLLVAWAFGLYHIIYVWFLPLGTFALSLFQILGRPAARKGLECSGQ